MLRLGVLLNTVYFPYSVSLLKGVERFCNQNKCTYYMLPLSHGQASGKFECHCKTLLNFVNKNNIDGLLILSTTFSQDKDFPQILQMLKKLPPIPKISLGCEIEGFSTLKIESGGAIKNLCEHLIEKHGVKKPLVMRCSKGNFESDEREAVVLKTFADHGIQIGEERVLNGDFLSEHAYSSLARFIREGGGDFDAVVCLNDEMAMGTYKCLAHYGFKVPEEVLITGFDDVVTASSNEMNITTVNPNIEKYTFRACENLCTMINGEPSDLQNSIEAKPIFRGSCGCVNEEEQNENLVSHFQQRGEMIAAMQDQFYVLHHFLTSRQKPILEKLYLYLKDHLENCDVRQFVLAFYDQPIWYRNVPNITYPNSAKVVMNFLEDGILERPDISFNPNENMFPPQIARRLNGGYTVMPLFAEDQLYGYMLFKFGHYGNIFYQIVADLVEREIISAIKYSSKIKEQDVSREKPLEENPKKPQLGNSIDELTGLLNGEAFFDSANSIIESAAQAENGGLVIVCAINDLEKINEACGRVGANRAIKYGSDIFKSIFRRSDVLARLGDDEFVAIVSGMTAQDFSRIKESLFVECKKINSTVNEPFKIFMCCGFARFDSENCNIKNLLSAANSSLNEEKNKENSSKKTFGLWPFARKKNDKK